MPKGPNPPAPPVADMRRAWVMVLVALSASAVGFLRVGSMHFLDFPLLTVSVLALVAGITFRPALVERLLTWRLAWAAAAFLAWALASSLLSGRIFSALFGSPGNGWGWLTIVAAAVIVARAASMRRSIVDVLTDVAPYVVVTEFAIQIWQLFTPPWEAGSFSNSTYLMMVLAVLLPFAARMPEGAPPAERRWRLAVVVMGIAGAAISGGRVGFALILVWVGWNLWAGSLGSGLSPRVRRGVVGGLAIAAVPAGIYAYARGGVGIGEFAADRMARFSAAWAGTLDRPLLGWGPDGFVNGAARHVSTLLLEKTGSEFGQFGTDPHNVVAWMLVSTGLVGTALAGWLAFEVVRNWRKQARSGLLEPALVWATSMYVVQILFAPAALQTVGIALVVFGASLAVERSMSPGEKGALAGAKNPAGRASLPRIVQVALCALLCVQFAYAATRSALANPDQQHQPQAVEAAARFWSDPYLWYHADYAWGWALQRGETGEAGRDLAAIRQAVHLEPSNPVYVTELARATAYVGRPDAEVRAAFERAYRVFPKSPDAHTAYAEYLLARDDTQGAWRQLKVVKDYRIFEVWRVLALYYDQVKDAPRAEYYRTKMLQRGANAKASGGS